MVRGVHSHLLSMVFNTTSAPVQAEVHHGVRRHQITHETFDLDSAQPVMVSSGWFVKTENLIQVSLGGRRIPAISTPSSESVYNRVGETVTLECRFSESIGTRQPTVTWYKLSEAGGRQKLYQYDGDTGIATEVRAKNYGLSFATASSINQSIFWTRLSMGGRGGSSSSWSLQASRSSAT